MIANCNGEVRQILSIANLDRLLQIQPAREKQCPRTRTAARLSERSSGIYP